MTACSSPGYNDNPSQQQTSPHIGCPAISDFISVYFSLHIQPAATGREQGIKKELFRSYCRDIPNPGKVFLTADLVGSELRSIPLKIRLVEQDFTGVDESDPENFTDLRTLSEINPRTYPKGVIQSQFELPQDGYYAIYLIRSGENITSEQDKLRIPLNVGVNSSFVGLMKRIVILFVITSALALIGYAASRYRRGRKAP